jgi:hypothetical protein
MYPQSPSSSRFAIAIGASLLIVLIVIISDVMIAASLTRDAIAIISQHLIALVSATWPTRSDQTIKQGCAQCQGSHRDISRTSITPSPFEATAL